MKAKLLPVTLIIFLSLCKDIYSIPTITNVTRNPAGIVGKYDAVEISFNLPVYSNPYDPNIISSYCEFWSPTNIYYKVDGFFYETFIKSNPNDPDCVLFPCEVLTNTGQKSWKIRFTPNELGVWQYKIHATDNTGSSSYPSLGKSTFTCTKSLSKGFIKKANNKFLNRTTGEFVFPVGNNHAWYGSPEFWGQKEYGTNEYKEYIDRLAEQNGNFLRIWLDCYEGMALIGKDWSDGNIYFDFYNQKDAWQLDWILEYAKSKKVDIMLCLFGHSSWGDLGYCNNNWSHRNPFNSNLNLGGSLTSPFGFFYDTQAIARTKKLLKYIVSRWGYSTNLLAWELWNEVNKILEYYAPSISPITFRTHIYNWHQTMYNYIKDIDPYDHLITTSYAGNYDAGGILANNNSNVYSLMDFTQGHDYKNPLADPNNHDFQGHLYATALYAIHTAQKPYLVGEWGIESNQSWTSLDPHGVELHNSLWSSSMSTSLGPVCTWSWDNYIYPQNHFKHYKPISRFMSTISTPSSDFSPARYANLNGLRIYYMRNVTHIDTIYGWAQDQNFHYTKLLSSYNNYLFTLSPTVKPPSSSSNNQIIIDVRHPNRLYRIEWYNTSTGNLYSTTTSISETFNSNLGLAKLSFSIPPQLRSSTFGDGAFKIYMDCGVSTWRDGILNPNINMASTEIVCNKNSSQIFYMTTDNKIHGLHWDSNSSSWLWTGLNNAATNVAGSLAISPDGEKVFYRTVDNKLNAIWWDSSINNWQWSNLNLAANGNVRGPIAVNSTGQVFYVTLDNKLHSIYWNYSTNSWLWSGLNTSANWNVGASIAINGNDQVFYSTLDQKLNCIWFNYSNSAWVWSNLNNAITYNVCGNISTGPDSKVFYATCDGKINCAYWNFDTNSWNWSGLNNAAFNVSNIVCNFNSQVFYRTIDKNIHSIYWNGNGWLWSELDEATSNNVNYGNLAADNNGNIFFRGMERNIHRLYYKPQCEHTPSTSFFKMLTLPISDFMSEEQESSNTENQTFVHCFPNPATDGVIITLNNDKLIRTVEVFSIDARKMYQAENLHQNSFSLNTTNYESGIYIVRIRTIEGNIYTARVVVTSNTR